MYGYFLSLIQDISLGLIFTTYIFYKLTYDLILIK